MKKIQDINKPMVLVATDAANQKPPTLKEVFLNAISTVPPQAMTGEKAIRLSRIGLGLLGVGNEIDLEDADFETLKEALSSQRYWNMFIVGQALIVLQDIEKKS